MKLPEIDGFNLGPTRNHFNRHCRQARRNHSVAAAFPDRDFCTFKDVPMVQTWSSWKRFPDIGGGAVEAPVGPGVYEVRHTMTGRVIAFDDSANVAQALADLQTNGGLSPFFRLFRRQPLALQRAADLEYRTCAAGSRAEARTAAHRLLGLRQSAFRRRADHGWTARLSG